MESSTRRMREGSLGSEGGEWGYTVDPDDSQGVTNESNAFSTSDLSTAEASRSDENHQHVGVPPRLHESKNNSRGFMSSSESFQELQVSNSSELAHHFLYCRYLSAECY